MSKLTNRGIKAVGDKMISMQKDAIDTEIRNILWGLVKCLMYKPGMEFQKCQDEFWECLGFKVPFEFPQCPAMYAEADKEISKFPTYRDYLGKGLETKLFSFKTFTIIFNIRDLIQPFH